MKRLSATRGRRLSADQISGDGLLRLLQRRAAKAKRFGCHDLRRSFASSGLDAGADISSVQQLMGHSSPATTARYDRRPERARRKAIGLLHVPYVAAGADR